MMHGGKSGAPIDRSAFKCGRYTAEAMMRHRQISQSLRLAKFGLPAWPNIAPTSGAPFGSPSPATTRTAALDFAFATRH